MGLIVWGPRRRSSFSVPHYGLLFAPVGVAAQVHFVSDDFGLLSMFSYKYYVF